MEKNKVLKQYTETKDIYDLFGKKLVDLIEGLLIRDNIAYQAISYRVKSEESFRNKVNKKNKYKDIKDITDVCGVRVITYYSDAVDKVAKIISEQFEVDEENTIDKRKALDPDRFGYLSLHYIISLKDDRLRLPEYSIFKDFKVEVQIRSISQHAWAEIEHDLGYKTKKEIPREIRRDFSRLASLLELVDKEFIEIRHKLDSYTNEVKESIKTSNEVTLIDSISLKQYISSSHELADLAQNIAILSDRILEEDELDLYSRISELENAGFKTIQEIELEIKNNKANIANFAKKILVDYKAKHSVTVDYIYKSSALFFLCYYKVCKSNSKDELDRYLLESNIHSIPLSSDKTFSEVLLEFYNDIISHPKQC